MTRTIDNHRSSRARRAARAAAWAALLVAIAAPVTAARAVDPACAPLPAALPQAQRKFHPGHYAAVGRDAVRRGGFERALAPGVVGVHLRYRWAELEPQEGRYDFSAIERDLDVARRNGVQLVAMIEDKTFDHTAPTPEYLRTRHTVPGHRGFTAARWDPYVIERLDALVSRLGEHFDCHPNFEGVAFQETSPSVNDDTLRRWGYTPERYRDALIAILRSASDALPRSRVFWYMNFLPGGQSYLGEVATALVGTGVVMGGPDVLPDNPALGRLVYPLYDRFRGRLPLFCSMQHDSYRHPRRDLQQESLRYWSMDELFAYARDELHVDYLFWEYRTSRTPPDSHDWTEARDVIARNPQIQGKRGRRRPGPISSRRSHGGDPQEGLVRPVVVRAVDRGAVAIAARGRADLVR
jgi:hypothetical protein